MCVLTDDLPTSSTLVTVSLKTKIINSAEPTHGDETVMTLGPSTKIEYQQNSNQNII